jgi:serine/threonine-protein kinase PknG
VTSDLYTVARTLAVLSLEFKGFSTRYVDRLPPTAEHPLLAEQESYHRLLLRATDRDPDARFATAGEFAEQLLGVLRQVLSGVDQVPRPTVSTRFTGERQAFGTAAGLIGPAAGGGALEGAAVVAALPVPQVDPTDPGAAVLLTVPGGDLADLLGVAPAAPADSVEVPLALARAHIAAGSLDDARAILDGLAAADPYEWRVGWYRGCAALVAGDAAAARAAFDAGYAALPGELAPQLALAAAAELDGDTDAALRRYRQVWHTDHTFVSAAFGVARILLGRDDRAGAVAVLDAVPTNSNEHHTAQVAAARARLAATVDGLAPTDLTDAAARVERLRLDVERHASITVEVLGTALDWVRSGPNGTYGEVLGHPLTERGLRLGLESAYRVLAKVAPDAATRVELVDQANRIRPRTWL